MPRTTKTKAGPARKSRAFSLPGISDKRSDVRNTPLTPTQRLDMLCRVIERLTLENDELRTQVRDLQGPADQAEELQMQVSRLEADLRQHDLERTLHEAMIRERERGIGDMAIDPAMINRIDPVMANTITTTLRAPMYQYWTSTATTAQQEVPAQQPTPDEPNVGEQQQ